MKKIRISFLLNSKAVYAYEAMFIQDLLKDDRFEVVGILLPQPIKRDSMAPWSWKLWSKHWLQPHSEAFHLIDLSEQFKSIPTIEFNWVKIKNGPHASTVSRIALERINELNSDVIISCQERPIRGKLLSLPPLGVWSFHRNSIDETLQLTGFWESYYAKQINVMTFQRIADQHYNNVILKKGCFASDLASLTKTRDKLFFEMANWVKSALIAASLSTELNHTDTDTTNHLALPSGYPTHRELLTYLFKLSLRKIKKSIHNWFYYQSWNIGIIPERIENVSNETIAKQTSWLPELPWPLFQADPFGIEIKQQRLLFLEEYDYLKGKGELKCVTLSKKNEELSRTTIDTAFSQHHSYPYVIHDKGKQYILPECLLSKQTSLYEVTDEQGTLKLTASLLNGLPVIDPSLVHFENRYWLFCTLASPYTDGCVSLHIFYSDSLTGPYQAHALNPVKSDVRSSRPAGAFFIKEGKLCRPAQDCSRIYGGAITILEIDKLTPTEFSEHVIDYIKPDTRYPLGMHSMSSFGNNHTLIDGKRYVFSFKKLMSQFGLRKKLTEYIPENLNPIKQKVTLKNAVEMKQHISILGMDEDTWCSSHVNIYAQTSDSIKQVLFDIEFPGWQPKKKQSLKLSINNKKVQTLKLLPGQSSFSINLPNTDKPIQISLFAKNQFRMPFPDKRLKSFRICEMTFIDE